MKLNQVYKADCVAVATSLKEKVNLVYADIIYGEPPSTSTLMCLAETLVPGGALFLQTDYRSVAELKETLDRFMDLAFINWIIWPYDWGGRPKNAFGRKHDDILYYARFGAKHKFNAKAIQIPKKVLINSTKTSKIPTDVWSDIGNFYTTSKERIKQKGKCVPWQKPETLLERIILATTDKGDLIFEPYLGTGTACAVAKRLGRRFIGCDLKPDMIELAKKRLDL